MAEQMEKELDIRIEEVESIADEEAKIWNPTVEVGDIVYLQHDKTT